MRLMIFCLAGLAVLGCRASDDAASNQAAPQKQERKGTGPGSHDDRVDPEDDQQPQGGGACQLRRRLDD